jgi:phosphate transport system ATP-binding protein
MNDLIDGTKKMTSVIIDGVDIYGKNTNVDALRKKRRDGFSKPISKTIYECSLWFCE